MGHKYRDNYTKLAVVTSINFHTAAKLGYVLLRNFKIPAAFTPRFAVVPR